MPIIRLEDGVSVIVPKEYEKFLEESKELTEKVVTFLNEESKGYSSSASALAMTTLLFLKAIRRVDEKASEDTREAILGIISEGR